LSQFRERRFDAGEDWSLAEFYEYTLGLNQMIKRVDVLVLGLVQQTEYQVRSPKVKCRRDEGVGSP
jgi:hypothetical protein